MTRNTKGKIEKLKKLDSSKLYKRILKLTRKVNKNEYHVEKFLAQIDIAADRIEEIYHNWETTDTYEMGKGYSSQEKFDEVKKENDELIDKLVEAEENLMGLKADLNTYKLALDAKIDEGYRK